MSNHEKFRTVAARALAATAASALIVGGSTAAADASSASPAAGVATADASAQPDAATAKQTLQRAAGTSSISLFPVERSAGGAQLEKTYVGASLGPNNTIVFWQQVQSGGAWTWQKQATRQHLPQYSGATGSVKLTGGLVKGAPDPVFIVKGAFTGNGTGQAIAYHYNGPDGWGVLTGQPDKSLRSSGAGLTELGQNGLELDISISRGYLMTSSMWGSGSNASNAEQKSNPILRSWAGSQGGFVMKGQTGGPSGGSS